jgi:outer membrane cobalamin receptor
MTSNIVTGQETATIIGLIKDSDTGEPLAGVNILIPYTFIGTASNINGSFAISDLAPRSLDLQFSMIGYDKLILQNVEISAGTNQIAEIKLVRNVLSAPQVIVSAARIEQDIMESPFAVSVVGPRQIQEKSIIQLSEILPYMSGVNTIRGQLNVRGASGYTLGAGSRSLILLDGVPLLGSGAGNISWTIIPASEIERVEVIKSAGGAMYGSSAMGGVLNVITKNASHTPETRIRGKIGVYSDPKYDQWGWRDKRGIFHTLEVTHSRPIGDHTGWVRFQKHDSDGYTALDWEDAYNITGKFKFNFGEKYTGSIYANYYDEKNGLASQWKSSADPFEAPPGDENDYSEGYKLNLNGSFNTIYSPSVLLKFKSGFYKVNWQNYGRTNDDKTNEQKGFGELQISKTFSDRLNIVSGISIQSASIGATIYGEHASRSTSIYALIQQKFAKQLSFALNGRWENFIVDGKKLNQIFSPQIGINWNKAGKLAARISIGKGFRVPTIAELFTQSQLNIFQVEPNPGLKTETSLAYELGFSWQSLKLGPFTNISFDNALFQTDFNNLIEPTPDESGIIHFENISDAKIGGYEASVSTSIYSGLLHFSSAYTRLNPIQIDKSGNIIDTLSYRYRQQWISTVSCYWKFLWGGFEYRNSSKIESVELFQYNERTGSDKRVPLHLWNIFLGLRNNKWEGLLRIDNLFQYYYVDLERNMGEERKISFTLSTTF